LYVLGIGTGADPSVISTCAIEAERHGYATLWSGEHVVMVDDGASRYPYADDGKIAVPAAADWLDPLMSLSYAAAVTSTIKLATGILLLPEHNPIVVAKPAASLDRLSRGRFVLGVGIGWSAEEFQCPGRALRAPGPADGELRWRDACGVGTRSRLVRVRVRQLLVDPGEPQAPTEIAACHRRWEQRQRSAKSCGLW
jgi:hypothetical protein